MKLEIDAVKLFKKPPINVISKIFGIVRQLNSPTVNIEKIIKKLLFCDDLINGAQPSSISGFIR